jgi:type II secretion system protein E
MQLLQILQQKNVVRGEDLSSIQKAQQASPHRPLHSILIEQGFAKEEDVLPVLAEQLGMDLVDLNKVTINPETMRNLPVRLVHRRSLLPISRDNGALVVATGDPFDVYAIDELQTLTGLHVQAVLASPREIARLLKAHFGVGGETVTAMVQDRKKEQVELLEEIEADDSEIAKQAQEASVVKLVNEILVEAATEQASDIHIEPEEKGLRIRYRIDGILHSQALPPEIDRFQNAIISRLKIMARLNIAEKRLPQDGRMKLRVSGREVDIRVSIIPMINGEGLVLRILDKGAMVFDLRKIGMEEDSYQVFRQLIDMPHGIVLVTGPTGSGKTTTLYSSLIEINQPDVKIITTEDPVEYQLEGINQIQVHAKIGLTFGASLRSILRHDPDIVLVGEIRDLETAENAIQASLTGHLVFSTLHTNDAASAYTRLVDMGVEPFLVASTVEGVMAQRLVRRLCEKCKQKWNAKKEDVPGDFPWDKFTGELNKSVGCRECRNTGYRGRMGIYELMVTTNEIRELANERVSSWKLMQCAVEQGMLSLRQDGWRKVLKGTTSVEEVVRAAKADHSLLLKKK